jgi:hypothetical protein
LFLRCETQPVRVQVLPSMFVESKNWNPGIGPAVGVVVELVVLMILEPELQRFAAEHELCYGQTGQGPEGRLGRHSDRYHQA